LHVDNIRFDKLSGSNEIIRYVVFIAKNNHNNWGATCR